MKIHELLCEQLVLQPRADVFAFFAKPENLARLTPPWMAFRILTPPPVPMHAGALIDYRIRVGPLPTRWRTLITAFEPPERFIDEQLAGPYSFWHHTHEFEETAEGTIIRDRIRYLMPFGPVGRLIHALVVRRQLTAIFAHRRLAVAELFPGVYDDRRIARWS